MAVQSPVKRKVAGSCPASAAKYAWVAYCGLSAGLKNQRNVGSTPTPGTKTYELVPFLERESAVGTPQVHRSTKCRYSIVVSTLACQAESTGSNPVTCSNIPL